MIVIRDTALRGAAMKSAVIVACRPSNEASAFILLFIVCSSGTLCSLWQTVITELVCTNPSPEPLPSGPQ